MSWVTNVMVSFCAAPADAIAKLTSPIPGDVREQNLRCITDWRTAGDFWGGSKVPECDIYAAAFNHVPLDAILDHVQSVNWLGHESTVQVFVLGQEDYSWSVWEFRGEEIVCVHDGQHMDFGR